MTRLQDAKLRALLRRAVEHVPFYRNLYRAHGVSTDAIAGVDDLWQLPAVIKSDYLRVGPEKYVDGRYDPDS